MKKTILTLAFLITLININAQNIAVTEGGANFSTGNQNALTVNVIGNTKSNVQDKWKSFLKEKKAETVKSSKSEIMGDNLQITEWGNSTVDIYTTFEEDKKTQTVVMHVAFDLGGSYLKSSEQKDKYSQAEKIVKDFAIKTSTDAINLKVKAEEKLLSKTESKYSKLEKNLNSIKENVIDNESKITISKNEIATLESQIIKKQSELDVQKNVVAASAGAVSEQSKFANKLYEKLVGQLKDLEKNKSKENDHINTRTEKTAKLKKQILTKQDDLAQKKTEVVKIQQKIDAIKETLKALNN